MNYVETEGNLVVLRGKVHDADVLQAASVLRRQGKGFTRNRGMRRIAAIDPERLSAVMLQGDKDALDFALSGYRDRKCLRRLLLKFPEWRTSEGAVQMECRRAAYSIRLLLGDSQKVKYSDYMLTDALNYAVSLLSNHLALAFSSIYHKRAAVPIADGEGRLPEDFGSLVRAEDEAGQELYSGDQWDLEGDAVLSSRDSLTMIYNRRPQELETLEDDLDIPPVLIFDVIDITAKILLGKLEDAEKSARAAAARLAQRREYGRIPDRRIWA